ncbi:MAG: type IV pilus biogenesis/stability protein PilW [Candidatus Methylumidiphilus sp.]
MSLRCAMAAMLLGVGLFGCSSGPAKDPNERTPSDLYVLKGLQYLENGRLDVAKQDLERAVALDENNPEAHNAMGVLHERLGEPALAEQEFRRALALNANHIGAGTNYGRILCAQGKYDEAMAHFQKAIDSKLYPTPWLALTNAGLCAKSHGNTAEAENLLRKALESNPQFAPALLEMARISLDAGNFMSTRAFLQRYDAVADFTPESLSLGVRAEQGLGNAKEADAYRKKLLRFFPDSKEAAQIRPKRAAEPPQTPPPANISP